MKPPALDKIDRQIINGLQGGFPICERPFQEVATRFSLDEGEVIERIDRLLTQGVLSRFGPMYNAENLGGAVTLCAMEVPQHAFEEVAEQVNQHRQVAHNYERGHRLNMWFVIATETPNEIAAVIVMIEAETGLKVFDFPKSQEFFVGLKVPA